MDSDSGDILVKHASLHRLRTKIQVGFGVPEPDADAYKGIPLFGNYVVKNRIRQPYMGRTGFNTVERSQGGIIVGGGSGRTGTSHTILSNNFISFSNIGVKISQWVHKTFILGNEFQNVDVPILDIGSHTVNRSNKVYSISELGERTTPITNSD
jgi:hypothetical protein